MRLAAAWISAGVTLAQAVSLAAGSPPGGALASHPPPSDMNQDDALVQTYRAELEGGVVAAGCGLRGKGPPIASGSIDLAGIPAGAQVVKAILNWSILENVTPSTDVTFHEVSDPPATVTGLALGSDESPCWSGIFANIYAFSADVTATVAAHGNASYTVALADSGDIERAPSAEGAVLIVVYCLASGPKTQVVIYEGVETVNNGYSRQSLSGFTAALVPAFAAATYVVADGQGVSNPDWGGRAKFEGVDVIGPPMDGDEGGRCGAQFSEFYDVDTVDVLSLVAPGATTASAEVESYSAPVIADCLTWTAFALAVSADTVDPLPPACDPCAARPVADAGSDVQVCAGTPVTLTGAASTGCAPLDFRYHWLEGALERCPWSPSATCDVTPSTSTTYTLEVACATSSTCVATARVTVDVAAAPAVDAGADVALCLGESTTLSAIVAPICTTGVSEWRWSDGVSPACPPSSSPDCLVTPTSTTIYTVEYSCSGNPCVVSDTRLVTVDLDVVPSDLGNSLRSVREAQSVAMSWGSSPVARSYSLHRGTAKGVWPPAALRSGLANPTDTELDVPGPPFLYLYRVAGASCSGREGP